jgi:molybdopterin molybdotransferase
MLSVAAAQELVLRHCRPLAAECRRLGVELLGQTLAEDVVCGQDSPPFDKALVDGYAVRSGDGDGLRTVVAKITAGQTPAQPLGPREAARIMTGAPVPAGADAVVMQEHVEVVGEGQIRLSRAVRAGENVMPRGQEMRQGEAVLRRGQVLGPQHLSLLAGLGQTQAAVVRRPVAGVLSTGDELVEPDQVPGPGQIRNSNGILLAAQVVRAGGVPHALGIARDDPAALRQHLSEGLCCDLLLVSGGVSAGTLDLVPAVLQELGVQALFHRVFVKPGKPLFFGRTERCLVFGLPGNPVSSLVGFELFVRPAVAMLSGRERVLPRIVQATLMRIHRHESDRPTYHPCRLQMTPGGWHVYPLPWFGSADLRSVCEADAFCILEAGQRDYAPGEPVPVLLPGPWE